jgi:hypothetical protein
MPRNTPQDLGFAGVDRVENRLKIQFA